MPSPLPQPRPPNVTDLLTTRQRQALLWGLVALGFVWLLVRIGPALMPFILSAVLAYLLVPLVDRLERWRLPRTLAVCLAIAVIVVAVLALVLVVVPVVQTEAVVVRNQIPALFDVLTHKVVPWLRGVLGEQFNVDLSSLRDTVTSQLTDQADTIARTAWTWLRSGSGVALSLASLALIVPFSVFYLLLDWPRLLTEAGTLVPLRWRPQVFRFLGEVDRMLGQSLRAQLLVMLLLATFYSVALLLSGFSLWLPIGILTGALSFIPYVGFATGLLLASLAAVTQFGWAGGLVRIALCYGVGQALESFVLTPRIVGGRIGLNPLAVIFALVAFGALFGFTGVLIALPLSAVMAVGLRWLLAGYKESAFYLESRDRELPPPPAPPR